MWHVWAMVCVCVCVLANGMRVYVLVMVCERWCAFFCQKLRCVRYFMLCVFVYVYACLGVYAYMLVYEGAFECLCVCMWDYHIAAEFKPSACCVCERVCAFITIISREYVRTYVWLSYRRSKSHWFESAYVCAWFSIPVERGPRVCHSSEAYGSKMLWRRTSSVMSTDCTAAGSISQGTANGMSSLRRKLELQDAKRPFS